jgi:pimeloyl-ACP methyl ester carboxylesterase
MTLETIPGSGGASIAIERIGQGKPLLVIHGAAASRKRWSLTTAELGKGRQLVLMDRRGRGDSTDGATYSIEQEYGDIAAVAKHIGERLDILAHSYGALCTLGAAPHLEHTDSIILYEPPLHDLPSDSNLPDRIETCVAGGDLEGGLRLFFRQVGVSDADFDRLRERPNFSERLAIVPTIPREVRTVSRLTFAPDYLGKITARTLLMLGSDSPPQFGRAIEVLAKGLANAKVEILPGQKHQAMDTAPALFVESVRAFLGD